MKTSKTPVCPLCDSPKVEIRRDRKAIYTYLKKKHILGEQEHTVCTECGTSFYEDGQIERNNVRFIAWSKGFVKDIAPWEIRELREKYDLSQEAAGRVFNCGSKTQFSKWERGEVAPTGTAALTLREALEDPGFMKRLADRAGVTIELPETSPAQPFLRQATFNYSAGLPNIMRDIHDAVRVVEQSLAFDSIISPLGMETPSELPEYAGWYRHPANQPLVRAAKPAARRAPTRATGREPR